MKFNISILCLVACAVAIGGCDDCSYTDEPLPNTVTSQAIVGVASITGTVLAVEPEHRRVTITCDDGVVRTFVVGSEVGDLSQIAAGDTVAATFTKKLATFVSKADAPPSAEAADSVAKVTDGSQGTAQVTEMRQVTWRVMAINAKDRTIRLEDPDGEVYEFDVPADVDLAAINVGDDIVARFTETINTLVKTSGQGS